MAEKQQAHQHEMESISLGAAVDSERQGRRSALLVTLVALCGAVYLLATGHSVTGLITLIAPLIGLVSLFAVSRRKRRPTKDTETDEHSDGTK